MSAGPGLEFENDIAELESRIAGLERQTERSEEIEGEIRELRLALVKQLRETYSSLNAWQTVQVARHKNRPYTRDYLNLAFDEFVELHGDKHFGDDRAMLSGFAKLDRFKVLGRSGIRKVVPTRNEPPVTSAALIPKATARR